ncbi:MAG: hypothetical protein R3B89_08735 [Polyangiaceae bacterium]
MRHARHRVIKVLLLLGALLGFAGGFASLAFRMHRHHDMRRSYFERHVADVCLDAADRRRAQSAPDYQSPPGDWGHGPAWGRGGWRSPPWSAPPWSSPPPPPGPPPATQP